MRSLQTQVRLRRLLRVFTDYSDRLADAPSDSVLAAAARTKLFDLAGQLHEAWADDSTTVTVRAIRRHVNRTLAAVDQAIASLGKPSSNPRSQAEDLQEAALPLLLMLRGMEDVADRQVLDWLGVSGLAKTA